jgi:hypothetical protein
MAYYFNERHSNPEDDWDASLYELDETSPTLAIDAFDAGGNGGNGGSGASSRKIRLRPHQLTALARCLDLERGEQRLHDRAAFPHLPDDMHRKRARMTSRLGVLADRVGSGKSYVMLALVNANPYNDDDAHCVETITSAAAGLISYTTRDDRTVIPTTVIVIPHNLSSQWDGYLDAWFGTDRTTTGVRLVRKQRDLDALVAMNRDEFRELKVVVVTATFYRKITDLYASVRVWRLVLDECDSINLVGASHVRLDASFLWCVTASYGNLLYPSGFIRVQQQQTIRRDDGVSYMRPPTYNRMADGITHRNNPIKSYFDGLRYLIPRPALKSIIVRNTDAFVASSIELPAMRIQEFLCRTPASIRMLHGVVGRSIMDRLNAGDEAGALELLNPANKGSLDNVVTALVERWQREAGNLRKRLELVGAMEFETEAERDAERDGVQKQLDDVDRRIDQVRLRVSAEADVCAICFDGIKQQTVARCCSNSFCFGCVARWLATGRAACPMCRSVMTMESLLVVTKEAAQTVQLGPATGAEGPPKVTVATATGPDKQLSKTENLEVLLRGLDAGAAKVLIFSAHDSFGPLRDVLRRLGLKSATLTGNGTQIASTVRRFKAPQTTADSLSVLMLDANSFGAGLNLENATDVILFHKMDSEMERQVIGRAQRYGRTTPLTVTYLLHDNEMSAASAGAAPVATATPSGASSSAAAMASGRYARPPTAASVAAHAPS